MTYGGETKYLKYDTAAYTVGSTIACYGVAWTVTAASESSVTVTTSNIDISAWSWFVRTPELYWPFDSAISDDTVYQTSGGYATITGHTMSGAATGFGKAAGYQTALLSENYVRDDVELWLGTASGQEYLYSGMTESNGITGTIDMFVLRNDGTSDSGAADVTIEFPADGYSVRRVNIPTGTAEALGISSVEVTVETASGTTTQTVYPGSNMYCVIAADTSIRKITYTLPNIPAHATYMNTAGRYDIIYSTTPGAYFGYATGDSDTGPYTATMQVAPHTGNTAFETVSVSKDAYVKPWSDVNYAITIGDIQPVTAGGTTTVSVKIALTANDVGSSWRTGYSIHTGYAFMKGAYIGLVLPRGITISAENVTSRLGGTISVEMRTIDGNDTDYLWVIRDSLGSNGFGYYTASLDAINSGFENLEIGLTTDFSMQSTAVSMLNRVYVLGLNDQGTTNTTCAADTYDLDGDSDKTECGAVPSSAGSLTVTAAAAAMDISTSFAGSGSGSYAVTEANKNDDFNMYADITCTSGGTLEAFSYLIPIVKTDAAIDTVYGVRNAGFSLNLSGAVSIEYLRRAETSSSGFTVYYTTENMTVQEAMNSTTAVWTTAPTDWSAVRMVMLVCSGVITEEDEIRVTVPLCLAPTDTDGTRDLTSIAAGSVAAWRSSGHYTMLIGSGSTSGIYAGSVSTVSIEAPFSISFASGASGTTGSTTTIGPINAYTDTVTVPDCGYTRAGYHFTGWQDANGTVYQPGDTVTGNSLYSLLQSAHEVTFTAVWAQDVYDISVTMGTGLVYQETPFYRWHPEDHSYEAVSDDKPGDWESAEVTLTVTSHSNIPVTVDLTYTNTADAAWTAFAGSFSPAQLTFDAYDSGDESAATQTVTLTMCGDLESFIADLVTGSPVTIGSVTATPTKNDTSETGAAGTAEVGAEFLDAGTTAPVYSVTIDWGNLDFVYTDTTGYVWDAATHTYTHTGDLTGTWAPAMENGDLVTVTNHSNVTVDATLTYVPDTDSNDFSGSLTEVSSTRAEAAQDDTDSVLTWTMDNGLVDEYDDAATATARLTISGTSGEFADAVIGELGLTLSVPDDVVVTPTGITDGGDGQ